MKLPFPASTFSDIECTNSSNTVMYAESYNEAYSLLYDYPSIGDLLSPLYIVGDVRDYQKCEKI